MDVEADASGAIGVIGLGNMGGRMAAASSPPAMP